jgi:Fur family ferric uptake transcriptional regulator
MSKNSVDILSQRNLKRTSCREGIIDIIMNSDVALSENEIRERLSVNFDRTTFYRSFKTLEENKIIHKIVADNQLIKYSLDNSVTHKKEHAHFYCLECESIRCLDDVPAKTPVLPIGFSGLETEVMIKGICSDCKTPKLKN